MPESVSVFSAIVTAIFLEAMPFLAIGALLSGAIEVLVSTEFLTKRIPKSTTGSIALGIAAGCVLPTCECGVVPVVRRLIKKGVPAPMAIAYMLSAPILNPVVLVSTFVAFRGSVIMLAGRMAVAIVVAAVMGLAAKSCGSVLRNGNGNNGSNMNDHSTCCHHGQKNRISQILLHAGNDFAAMVPFLILGAVASGLFKAFTPQGVFMAFTANPTLQVSGMMVLAVLLSVCSEADAFVAASFQPFSAASQLAFVTIGPMVDLKLIGMYAALFTRRFFWILMIVPAVIIFLISVFITIMT